MAADQQLAEGARTAPPTPICVRGEVIVMQDADDYPFTIENTPYNRLRYMDYAGRRIMYAFDGSNTVEETYTPGIFNCRFEGGRLIQVADTAAVTECIVSSDAKRYVSMCVKWWSATVQKDYLDTYVRGSRRLSYNAEEGAYEVDGGMFRVNDRGNAYSAQFSKNGKRSYRPLCIVNTQARSGIEVVDPQLGRIVINEKTQMIVAKLMFLLHPAADDDVFLGQLGKTVRQHVDRLIAAGPPASTYDATAAARYDDVRGVEAPLAPAAQQPQQPQAQHQAPEPGIPDGDAA